MPEFKFKRTTTIEHTIEVWADDYSKAYAKAAVGGLDWVREKEGVEVSDCIEKTVTECWEAFGDFRDDLPS